MPRQSIASQVIAWESALANIKASAGEIPNLDVYTAPLEQILEQAKDLNARLEMRKGVKQQESVERRTLLQMGKIQAYRVRAALKAHFGPHSERLIEFGARPIRPRVRKKKQQQDPAPEPPPTPEVAQPGAPQNPTAP
jgi:hypothetical protein